ncbi:MAG: PleD family two-component system response regulator [Rhodospirillales bacterium]|nr:PleD family two-component system response regulator [Rhodospirillales bacterium]
MSARILVVDDVEINVKLLGAKLASEYFDVLTASSGAGALRVCEAELPDLVLLDVMMPEMDGFEVCRRLKADPRTADIPVVMVTALSDAADRLRGLEAGADDFLTKPVNDIALFARVRSLVRLKRMMEEWRLREEVCGRFAALPDDYAGAAEMASPARIMLLEESRLAATRITDALAPLTSDMVHVTTVKEATEKLDSTIELVIASMGGGGDGDPLRLVSHSRASEQTRQVPILLVAEESDLPRLAKGLDLGANDYLLRPIDRNELIARVRTQIRRKRLHDRLRENYHRSLSLALTDPLTGLYNRRYLAAHLDGMMTRADESGVGPALLLFDIDRFKQVNDTYGHLAGDEVLCEIASRALHDVRSFDLVARYGGEEFLVVMPETNLQVALVVAERLRLSIAERPFAVSGTTTMLPVTVSVGVSTTLSPDDTPTELLRRADEALYAAKNNGRNRVLSWPVADSVKASRYLGMALP